MLRFFGTLGLVLLLTPALSAQIPGYLGKRFSLQADLQTMQALQGPTANNRGSAYYGAQGGGFALNWRAGLSGGYAISRERQLYLGVDYLKTGMVLDVQTVYDDPFFDLRFTDDHSLFYNLTAKTATVGIRTYNINKGAIAPFGPYSGIFLEYSRVTGAILDKQTNLEGRDQYQRTEHAPLGIQPKMNYFVFGYEFGKNFIVADRFVLNLGAKLRLPLQIFRLLQEEDPDIDNQTKFENEVISRLGLHSLLTVNVGGGFLF